MDVLEISEDQVVADAAEHWNRWARYGQAMALRQIANMNQLQSRRSRLAWVALAYNCTQAGAERKAALADALTSYLPRTLEALENGVIDEHMASKVFEATACASSEVAAEVDSRLRFENRNPGTLRRTVNALLMRVDPEGYEQRRQAKTAARMLEIRHGDHGSSTLFAELPFDRAQAIYALCDRYALEKKREGDQRTMDQLRVDALVELCLGGECGGKPKAQIFVYVDLFTLMGLRTNPAELAGCGEISPEMAREIAYVTNSVWNRIVSEPMTGLPVDMGRKSYRPSKRMRRYVQVLHRTCYMPGCSRPAQYSDLDHIEPWSEGGGTDKINFRPFCRVHHGLCDEPGWEFHTDDNGVITVTTPDGRTYTEDPDGFI